MGMSSTASSASSSPSSTASQSSNAANPFTSDATRPVGRTELIAIGVVVGLVLASSVVIMVAALRHYGVSRTQKSTPQFRRSATPLPDTEFDKWRKPSKNPALYHSGGETIYKSSGLRYDGLKSPAPLVHAFRVPSSTKLPTTTITERPTTPPRSTKPVYKRPPPLLDSSSPHASVRPLLRSTTTSTVETQRSRHKSSVSIQDRPPTPYSPSSPPSTWDNDTLWHEETPTSPREKRHQVHLSDTSDFGSDFGYGPPDSPRREPLRRESWVHHSRRFSSLGSIAHPNYQNFDFDIEAGKKLDY